MSGWSCCRLWADRGFETNVVGRRHVRSNNSWMHNVNVLVKGRERCTLQVHPGDAEAWGLADGGKARITSAAGSVVAPVEVNDDIARSVGTRPRGPRGRWCLASPLRWVR